MGPGGEVIGRAGQGAGGGHPVVCAVQGGGSGAAAGGTSGKGAGGALVT